MNFIKVFNVSNLIQSPKMSSRDSEFSYFMWACIQGLISCNVILQILGDNYPWLLLNDMSLSDKDITACVENPDKNPGTEELLKAIQNLAKVANAKKSVDLELLKAYKEELVIYLDYLDYIEECEETGKSSVFLPSIVCLKLFPDYYS